MTEETHNMTTDHGQPELKQVLGALLFAARKPIAAGELRGVLAQVDQKGEDAAHSFGKIQESNIRMALEQLKTELGERKLGLILVEVAGGFRFQTDPSGGPWVRQLLNLDKPARLSKPALETLAIIAYRQPTTRAEIEALRGVNVDAMMRHLLELQLIRIVGRSDLPGRPLMYGTTQLFLEHFGLSSVKNLPGVEQLSRRDAERAQRKTDDRCQPALRSLGEAGTTDDIQQKTEEANVEHPTPGSAEALRPGESNAQRRMEERTEDGSTNGTNADKEEAAGKDQDKAEKTEPEEEEAEEEEEEEEEEEADEDEDIEGRK